MLHLKKLAFLFVVLAVILTACSGGAAPTPQTLHHHAADLNQCNKAE